MVAPKFGGVGSSCKTWGGFVCSLLIILLKLWDPCCRRAADGDCVGTGGEEAFWGMNGLLEASGLLALIVALREVKGL